MHFARILRKDHPLAKCKRPREIDILEYPVILPASVEPIYSDIAQRYAHNGLPPPQPQYVADDINLIMELVSSTDAYHPLHHPSPRFGDLANNYLLLQNLVKMPKHHVSLASSTTQPLDEVTSLFERTLVSDLDRIKNRKSNTTHNQDTNKSP